MPSMGHGVTQRVAWRQGVRARTRTLREAVYRAEGRSPRRRRDRLLHTFDSVCGEISRLVNQPLGRRRAEHGVRHHSTL